MKLSQWKAQARRMSPLLRSIAKEIVERTAAIAQIECQLAAPRKKNLGQLVSLLASHRRELRLAEAELTRLGWKREKSAPLRFSSAREDGVAWQPDESVFYLDLGLSWSA